MVVTTKRPGFVPNAQRFENLNSNLSHKERLKLNHARGSHAAVVHVVRCATHRCDDTMGLAPFDSYRNKQLELSKS